MRQVGRRVRIVVALTVVVSVLGAAPAAAHVRAEDASNWHSTITAAPDLPDVEWTVYAGGLDIEVVNRSDVEITILGYEGEPYLRIGPAGVDVNRNSPAAYLNADRYGDVAVPRRADASAAPDWHRVNDEPRAVWHDHRTHWMAPDPPASVTQDRRQSHLVQTWQIPILLDGTSSSVTGELWWIPHPATAQWLLATIVLTLAAIGIASRLRADRALLVGAIALGAVAAANAIHLADEIVARPLATIDIVAGALHTGLFVVIGVGTALWAWRGGWGRRLVLAFGSATVLIQEGLLQTVVLRSSQITSIWPAGLVRALAVAGIVQAGIVLGAIIATRPTDGPEPDRTIAPRDQSRLPAGVG